MNENLYGVTFFQVSLWAFHVLNWNRQESEQSKKQGKSGSLHATHSRANLTGRDLDHKQFPLFP